ncbi:MAG: hypothetical protein U9R43_16030 [Thermodesulfobacteriota bacterium]|nr:hypothetical protein [Thermodesulfobacteriota bacterium]
MLLRQIGVLSNSYVIFKRQHRIGTRLAHILFSVVMAHVSKDILIRSQIFNKGQKEEKMKKLMVQLFIIGVVIATYALPVMACGGAGL